MIEIERRGAVRILRMADGENRLTVPMQSVVSARLPHAAACDAIVTGRRYGAAAARRMGIVEHVAVEERVLGRAVELAAEMADKDRSVIAAHKQMLFGATAAACGWSAAGPSTTG